MVDMLPKLFSSTSETSFVAERDGGLAAFCRFLSQTRPEEAYVHFVGVNPAERGGGLGRELYERLFEVARRGRRRVSCVTSPLNSGSVAFHTALGFEPSPPQAGYDGPGEDRVVLTRAL